MSRQRDLYRELYEKVKPLESEVEISKEVITQLRTHIESLKKKEKLKERELKAAQKELKAAEEQVRKYKVERFALSNHSQI